MKSTTNPPRNDKHKTSINEAHKAHKGRWVDHNSRSAKDWTKRERRPKGATLGSNRITYRKEWTKLPWFEHRQEWTQCVCWVVSKKGQSLTIARTRAEFIPAWQRLNVTIPKRERMQARHNPAESVRVQRENVRQAAYLNSNQNECAYGGHAVGGT